MHLWSNGRHGLGIRHVFVVEGRRKDSRSPDHPTMTSFTGSDSKFFIVAVTWGHHDSSTSGC